ncbi:hypothetical protein OB13_10855 [Pontibacter sp. HJ8]
MITYTLNGEERQAKTSWYELTLGEYLQVVSSGKIEAVCLLSGLTIEEYNQADEGMQALFAAVSAVLDTEPVGFKPDWLAVNLGADTIGKLELCRKYVKEFEEEPEQAFPFLYAIYHWPEEYDSVYVMSGAGFPQHLVERATQQPLAEAIGVVVHVLQESNRLNERYAPILDKDPTEEQFRAGIEKFEKYGFYATLLSYCSGDLSRLTMLLKLSADVFYTALCVDTEKADYEEKYRDIMSQQR